MKSAQQYGIEILRWAENNFPYIDGVGYGMAEELGEMCHHILKFKQKIRGGVGKDAPRKFKLEMQDAIADCGIFLLQWAAKHEIVLNFEEGRMRADDMGEFDNLLIFSQLYGCQSQIFAMIANTGVMQIDHSAARSVGQRMLNSLFMLAMDCGWDFVEECFEPTWEQVKQRNWQKFPKNGLTE